MIICLNGTSSSGKTTLAKKLQEIFPGYLLNFSIDHILYSLPPSALAKMTSGQANPGLQYSQLEEGFYQCVRVLAELGHDLVIDNAIVSEKSAKRMEEALQGFKVIRVGLNCDLDELKKRELNRGDRTIGEAERQNETIHQFCKYDILIDCTNGDPKRSAREILDWIQ